MMVGSYGDRGFSRSSWPVRCGGLLAVVGGVLIGVGALWLFLSPMLSGSLGVLSVFLRLAGPVGVLLTMVGLLGVYALLVKVRSGVGVMVGAFGVFIALLSAASLVWIVIHQPPFVSPSVGSASVVPTPFLAVAAVVVGLVRPIGILFFFVAALLARVRGGWKYLLLVLAILETVFVSNLPYYFLGPAVVAGWPVLLFGIPGVQSGVIGAAVWILLGYALLRAGSKTGRRVR